MARIAALLSVLAYGSCMQMRETVERTVLVRTTGSDLQPAATGYIYKKESDGPASVTKMGEHEVIQHFSKIYGKPEAYKAPAPVPAGPFHAKEEDGDKAASHTSEEHVKPVVEHAVHDDGHIEGIADEDYDKIFEEYAKQLRDDKRVYGDYSHGLGNFDHDVYHGYGGGKEDDAYGYHGYGDKGFKGYGTGHHYNKGDDDGYHKEKHEGFKISKEGGHKNGYDKADDHGKHYAHGHGYKGDDEGYKSGHDEAGGLGGFHKVFDHKEYKKHHDFYDGGAHKVGLHKYGDGYGDHGSGSGGYEKEGAHDSGDHEGGFGKGGFVEHGSGGEGHDDHSSGQGGESAHDDRDFSAKESQYDGKSYGFEIKH